MKLILRRMAELKGVQFEHLELRNEWNDRYNPRFNTGIRLLPPQKLGVFFLHMCSTKFGYALLGDEMGYGKVRRRSSRSTDSL